MNPILKELIYSYLYDFDTAFIGSILTKHAEAKDIDVLFFNIEEFKAACKRMNLKYQEWDGVTGHILRANLQVLFTLKPIQLIHDMSCTQPEDFKHTYMLKTGVIYNEDKPFIKDGSLLTAKSLKVSQKKEQNMQFIAVDFDGTIRDWDTNKPLPRAKETINILREKGWKILIHSCNSSEFIKQWMNDNDIRYDSIWSGTGKPVAAYYLDDRGLKFTTWDQALKDIDNV